MAKNLEISFLLDFYGEVLTEKQREVMEQYYNDDLSLAEIADHFDITRQGVRDAIKRGEATVLELEEKIGFARRYRAMQEGLVAIESHCRNMLYCNEADYHPSNEITKSGAALLDVIKKLNQS